MPIADVESGAWLPDGRVALIGVGDHRVRTFDVAGQESLVRFPSGRFISVSPAGAIVLIDDVAGTLTLSAIPGVSQTIDRADSSHTDQMRPLQRRSALANVPGGTGG